MASENLKIACIGECMIELAPTDKGEYRRNFAGDTFNTAVYFKRQFGERLQVSYISALGCDSLSSAMLEKMQQEGLETDLIRCIEGKNPGLYLIENDPQGERFFSYWRNNSAARSMFKGLTADDIYQMLAPFDVIYLSGISLAILDDEQRKCLLLALSKLKGQCLIAFDPNFRQALWNDREQCINVFKQMGAISSIILSTFDDDLEIWGNSSIDAAARRWLSWGDVELVVKNGAWGCSIFKGKNQCDIAPPMKIAAVDTTGAGDSFSAGYVGAKLMGASVKEAALLGHQVAAQVIQYPGGVIAPENWQVIT